MNTAPLTRNYHLWTLATLASLLLFRLVANGLSPLGLHGDEAQYWAWSKDLDWGYFTKPPVIAWVIWVTTGLFGDAEWAVRLSSPILHSVTAYVIFHTARFVYDARTGFWAALLYITMPAVWLSSAIVSTDVPLLLCWAIALNAWTHLRVKTTWPRALQLGIAFGFGVMAKYAMLFFLPALALAFLFDPATRKGLNTVKGYAGGFIAFLIILPNIIWNINHDFATLTHTAANANLKGELWFHPLELISFWVDQLGVFGPVTMGVYVLAIIAAMRRKLETPSFWLAIFGLSPLVIISIEALLSRANANWASTSYVAAAILTAHYGLWAWERLKKWLMGGMGLNIVAGLALTLISLSPIITNALGFANAVKRNRAWPETVAVLKERLSQGHEGQVFTAIASDKRIIFYDLKYYGLGDIAPLHVWRYQAYPQDHAELTASLSATKGPVLIVNYYPDYVDEMQDDFARLTPLPPLDIDLGGGKKRKLSLWAGYDYTPTTGRD